MPYFITDESPDCAGWATIKEDGEVIGCHTTKQAAIDQMVAVSIAEKMEPGGERAAPNELMVGDYVSWDSSGGRARGEIQQIFRSGTVQVPGTDFQLNATKDDPVALIQIYEKVEGGWEDTDVIVGHKFSTLTRIGELEEPEDEPEDEDSDEDEMEDRALPTNYRPASSADVPANHNCGNCGYYKNLYCTRWYAQVSPAYYCNAWEPVQGLPNDNPGQTVQTGQVSDEDPNYFTDYPNIYDRQLSFEVPVYIRAAARKGLDYYGQGLGGDGLVARTIREARDMAAGRISEDKVIRANAWGARHLVDLEAPQNSDADNDGFPGAGAVAFYLWGINPLNPGPAMNWFERQANRVKEQEDRELRKDQPRDKIGRFAGSGATYDDVAKDQDSYFESRDEATIEALSAYKGGGYASINSELRHGEARGDAKYFSKERHDAYVAKTALIDDAVNNAPPLKSDVTVFRGVRMEGAARLENISPGDVMVDKGFMSTSFDQRMGEAFGTVSGGKTLKITVPKGSRALALDHPRLLGEKEAELLLPRNTNLRVTKVSGNVIEAEVVNG